MIEIRISKNLPIFGLTYTSVFVYNIFYSASPWFEVMIMKNNRVRNPLTTSMSTQLEKYEEICRNKKVPKHATLAVKTGLPHLIYVKVWPGKRDSYYIYCCRNATSLYIGLDNTKNRHQTSFINNLRIFCESLI